MAGNRKGSGLARLKAITLALAVSVATAGPALAQDNPASAPQQPAVGAVALLHVQARVVAIDPATNSVTLRGPQGGEETFDVNREAADVSKLHIGDIVTIAYKKAVLVGVDKLAPNGIRQRIDTEVTQPAAMASSPRPVASRSWRRCARSIARSARSRCVGRRARKRSTSRRTFRSRKSRSAIRCARCSYRRSRRRCRATARTSNNGARPGINKLR